MFWTDLRIAAVNTNAMAIDEIDSDEEIRSRLRRKKETLEMDDNLEIQGTRGTEGSDPRGSRDPVPRPLETSIAQRSAPDLVLWSDEPGGLLEPAQEERKARGKSVPIGPNPAEKATHELTHGKFQKLVQLLRASQSCGRSSSQKTTQRARVPNHHGRLLFHAGFTWW